MRPRVKPALLRIDHDERTLQLGAHPGRAVVLRDLTRRVRRWIDTLDGTRDLDQALREGAAAGVPEPAAFLDSLTRTGVLHDASVTPPSLPLAELDRLRPDLDALDLASQTPGGGVEALRRRRRTHVRVYGAGRVGAQVVGLLAAAGVGTIRVIDPGTARPQDLTPGGLSWEEVGSSREEGAVRAARRLTWSEGGHADEGPDRQPHPAVATPRRGSAHAPELREGPEAHRLAGASAGRRGTEARSHSGVPKGPSGAGVPDRSGVPGERDDVPGGRDGVPGGRDGKRGRRAGRAAGRRYEPGADVRAGGPPLSDRSHRPDLVILTPVRPLDGVLVNELNELGLPHLLGSAFEGHGSVGPLVLPGQSACLHCLDLARRDHDPDWPIVTARLGGYPPGEIACDTPLAGLVAAAVTGHALAYLDGREPVVTNGTVHVLPDWQWKRQAWDRHPQCRCMRNNPYPLTMVMSASSG
ncbi:ThiF family adenylyltransferase [Nonomuraea sp. NPDC049725]|uniref:ThiF family adenylyltransferase n=1 Tax=Nonomuraea sp. NPDC049725 TaxID=3154508 RepID=UPI0034325EDE